MEKQKQMLKIYLKALKNDLETLKLLTPNSYQKNIYTIDYQSLKQKGYKNLIFDVDNTIMPLNDIKASEKLQTFFQNLAKDFNICLFSNNSHRRVKPVGDALHIPYLAASNKPLTIAFQKALNTISADTKNTVLIGDQLLTDIAGGNQFGIYTILVNPIENNYSIQTNISNIFQNVLIRRITKLKDQKYY